MIPKKDIVLRKDTVYMKDILEKNIHFTHLRKSRLTMKLFTNRNSPKTKISFWGYSYGASVPKKQLGNLYKIKALGIRQTAIAPLY